MLIRHIGHAEFLIELEEGLRIVTDPYDASCGYPVERLQADAALVSHHHHDHDAVDNLTGNPRLLDQAGSFTLSAGAKLTAVRGYHDDAQGAKRGETLLFLLEAEGLRIEHLGDLGDGLTEEQLRILKKPDVLLIPVGGFFTIDAKKAKETADALEARIVIPMHYRTAYTASWPIGPVDDFLSLYEASDVQQGGQVLRVTRGDLECHPRVVVL